MKCKIRRDKNLFAGTHGCVVNTLARMGASLSTVFIFGHKKGNVLRVIGRAME
jgi:hypothetical protein